jgi:hypothetical protein
LASFFFFRVSHAKRENIQPLQPYPASLDNWLEDNAGLLQELWEQIPELEDIAPELNAAAQAGGAAALCQRLAQAGPVLATAGRTAAMPLSPSTIFPTPPLACCCFPTS